jgi:hypothetical protein
MVKRNPKFYEEKKPSNQLEDGQSGPARFLWESGL